MCILIIADDHARYCPISLSIIPIAFHTLPRDETLVSYISLSTASGDPGFWMALPVTRTYIRCGWWKGSRCDFFPHSAIGSRHIDLGKHRLQLKPCSPDNPSLQDNGALVISLSCHLLTLGWQQHLPDFLHHSYKWLPWLSLLQYFQSAAEHLLSLHLFQFDITRVASDWIWTDNGFSKGNNGFKCFLF